VVEKVNVHWDDLKVRGYPPAQIVRLAEFGDRVFPPTSDRYVTERDSRSLRESCSVIRIVQLRLQIRIRFPDWATAVGVSGRELC